MRSQSSARRTITACGLILLSGCERVQDASEFPSPDSQWVAILEHIDNGAGFGQGELFEEVSLNRPNMWRYLFSHGAPDSSVVFRMTAAFSPTCALKLR